MPPVSRRLREALSEILRATNAEVPSPDEPWHRAILGYFQQARLMLRALLVLGANDLDHAGEALARTTYELAATAAWLEKDPARFERLMAAYDTEWAAIRREWEKQNPGRRFQFADDFLWCLLSRGRSR
jgi:hypothetical protein